MDWPQEVERLHRFFEQWFNGACPQGALHTLEAALEVDFSMVTPSGECLTRDDVISRVTDGYGKRSGLRITVHDFATILDGPDVVAGRYVERHEENGSITERTSLALFHRRTPEGSLRWVAVHETWRPES